MNERVNEYNLCQLPLPLTPPVSRERAPFFLLLFVSSLGESLLLACTVALYIFLPGISAVAPYDVAGNAQHRVLQILPQRERSRGLVRANCHSRELRF